MKNLLIYFNPDKTLSPEHDALTKIQIDNSLELGWKKEDILLAMNFPYEYKGVKAYVTDGRYDVFDGNRSSKIPIINRLFDDGMIKDGETYWFHDHDAFQLDPFNLKLNKDAGFTNHGWSRKWNAGSFFFKSTAKDIFQLISKYMEERQTNEQDALTYLWGNNIDDVNSRYRLMNITYNIGIYFIDRNLARAELPVKVAHFHPHKVRHLNLFRSLIPDRLLNIFRTYGIK